MNAHYTEIGNGKMKFLIGSKGTKHGDVSRIERKALGHISGGGNSKRVTLRTHRGGAA